MSKQPLLSHLAASASYDSYVERLVLAGVTGPHVERIYLGDVQRIPLRPVAGYFLRFHPAMDVAPDLDALPLSDLVSLAFFHRKHLEEPDWFLSNVASDMPVYMGDFFSRYSLDADVLWQTFQERLEPFSPNNSTGRLWGDDWKRLARRVDSLR